MTAHQAKEIVPAVPLENTPKKQEPRFRENRVRAIALVCAATWIGVLTLLLEQDGAGAFLLDRDSTVFPYPLTIQNLLWTLWWCGLGEVWMAARRARDEESRLRLHLLPEEEETMLRRKDLGRLRKTLRKHEQSVVGRLALRAILQFQASGGTDRTTAVLTTGLDLLEQELETRYKLLQYITWLLPTVGFIGTVVGIAAALAHMGNVADVQDPNLLAELAGRLGVAFHTTLLALLLSATLVLATTMTQQREERILNEAGQYCLDNLINRLYEE